MAVRTTSAAVIEVLLDSYVSPDSLTPFIEAANQIVTDLCLESGYSDEKLERIERWLSAHCYAISKRLVLEEAISGGPRQIFDKIPADFFIYNTAYGQQAMALDTDGNIAGFINALMDTKNPPGGAQVIWLGTENPV